MKRLRWRIRKSWYEQVHGIQPGSMLPLLGHGRFVSVRRRGHYLDLICEADRPGMDPGAFIRLIPYRPNHGVMVEFWSSPEHMQWRTHCDIGAFAAMGPQRSEVVR